MKLRSTLIMALQDRFAKQGSAIGRPSCGCYPGAHLCPIVRSKIELFWRRYLGTYDLYHPARMLKYVFQTQPDQKSLAVVGTEFGRESKADERERTA